MATVIKPPAAVITAICNAINEAITTADLTHSGVDSYNGVVYIPRDAKSSYKIHVTWDSEALINIRVVLKPNVVTK